VSHGYRRVGYGYPAYPISSYGTIAGGSLYAPLYNRPAFTCY
jgi:hypothetical protein